MEPWKYRKLLHQGKNEKNGIAEAIPFLSCPTMFSYREAPFEEAPFLEITPTHKETTTFNISKANGSSVTRKTEEIETPISQFNKKELCDYIISNGSLASQKLLKLAVAYRFAADHYSGNGSGGSIDVKDIADEEEFRMIKDIVVAIVQDYNLLRKELKLDYNENEIKTGIPEL